jgi:phosphoglucosamine mutase
MTQRSYFGTDGIRARVGSSNMQADFILKLGFAIGVVLAKKRHKRVLIGKDTRISGYMLESALEAGLSSAGIDTLLVGPMPTPAVAYLTRTFVADAGIVISASHNPFCDNGIKIFSFDGGKLTDKQEIEIEKQISCDFSSVAADKLGRAFRIDDAAGRYIEYCKSTSGLKTNLKQYKIVVDCANGATYNIAPKVFAELGAKVVAIANKPDGININLNCGATDTKLLSQEVLGQKADFGIALDGDGDRLMMVDDKGELVGGDILLYLIVRLQMQRKKIKGVVGTQMSNFALEKEIKNLGLTFVRADVGDRYVLEQLHKNRFFIGGESSGHLINLNLNSTGDGIVSALQVIKYLQKNKLSLNEAKQSLLLYPQIMQNIKTNNAKNLLQNEQVCKEIKKQEQILNKDGRVLVRASGTESLIRVMAEGKKMSLIKSVVEKITLVLKKNDK